MKLKKNLVALVFIWFLAQSFNVIENFYWLRIANDLRPNLQIFISGFLQFLFGIVVIFYLVKLLLVYDYKIKKPFSQFILHLLNISLLSFLTFFAAAISFFLFEKIPAETFFSTLKEIFEQSFIGFIKGAFYSYFLLTIAAHFFHFFEKSRIQELENATLQSKYLETKLQGLRSQLNPHLLFNSLNTIVSFIDSKPKKAKDMIVDLSFLLRRLLESTDHQIITLSEELAFLEKYLTLEKARFSDSLKIEVKVKVEEDLLEKPVPNLLLQPILENSLIHGFNNSTNKIFKILLDIHSEEEDMITFIISDNGNGLKSGNKFVYGFGLNNVITRLDVIYNKKAMFEINPSENGVTTIIKIPINNNEEA